MFVLPSQPSFAETFGGHLGTNIVNTATERSELAKRNEEIKKGFAKLGENPSRIELLQTIESLNVPESTKERLYKGFGDAEKDKLTREKTAQELEKSEKQAVRAKKLAQSYNISEEEAEGLEPTDIAALGRNRQKNPPGGVGAQPVPSEVGSKIKQVLNTHRDATADELAVAMDEQGIPQTYSNKYIESRRREEDRKIKKEELEEGKKEKSYTENKPFIDKTTDSFRAWESETKPKLLQMQSLNEGELISPGAAKILEDLRLPLGILDNQDNEYYSKLSQDLLKGLPETFGNRILQVEVQNFLKTIPTLLNSTEGRRMITSNMLKLGEMKEIVYDEMRNLQKQYIDADKKLPKDFQQRVIDNIRPLMQRQQQDFLQLSQMKSVPKGHVPFFNPQGTISFVPNSPEALEWAKSSGGRRIW